MELDTLLRDTRGVPAPTAHSLDDGRAALEHATGAATVRVAAARRLKRRRRSRVGVLALVGAAATAALVIGPTLDLGGDTPPDSAAADVMLTAAAAAGAQPDLTTGAPYWYSLSESEDGAGIRRQELWLGRTEPGTVVGSNVSTGEEWFDGVPVYSFQWGEQRLGWDDFAELPMDPDVVREQLLTGFNPESSRSENDQLITMITDILVESPAPPAVRQALWEVAATLPGVDVVGDDTDAAGRPGVLLTLDNDDYKELDGSSYLIDPSDGRLLEVRWPARDSAGEVLEDQPAPAPGRTTYLESGPVDTAPTPPPPPPGCPDDYRGC